MNALAAILVMAIIAVVIAWAVACVGNILDWWNV